MRSAASCGQPRVDSSVPLGARTVSMTRTSLMVGQILVVVLAAGGFRVRVHHGRGQLRYVVDQPMFGLDSDLMRRHEGQLRVEHDLALGPQAMADPAHAHGADVADAFGGPQ